MTENKSMNNFDQNLVFLVVKPTKNGRGLIFGSYSGFKTKANSSRGKINLIKRRAWTFKTKSGI